MEFVIHDFCTLLFTINGLLMFYYLQFLPLLPIGAHGYCPHTSQGPFARTIFHCISISMENSFCCHPTCSKAITSKFCTCHDSWAVVTCAKCCNDIIPHSGVTWKPIFHQIQITMEKLKWAPWILVECQTLISWRVAWIRLDYSRIKGISGVSSFNFDEKFILLSSKLQYGNHFKILHMSRQLCCRDMCKML